jgi:hypothetical protein
VGVEWVERSGGVRLAPTATLTDADSESVPLLARVTGATLQISHNYDPLTDFLTVDGTSLVNTWVGGYTWDNTTGTLALTRGGSLAEYQEFLREVRFDCASKDLNLKPRTVSITVRDGSDASPLYTMEVRLTVVNDEPELHFNLDVPTAPLAYVQQAGEYAVLTNATLVHDNKQLLWARVTVQDAAGKQVAGDKLNLDASTIADLSSSLKQLYVERWGESNFYKRSGQMSITLRNWASLAVY